MVSAPDARQADLAAVGVTGEDGVVPVGGELVEHPEVRRVRDASRTSAVGVGRAGDLVEPVVAQVRVVDAGEREGQVADLDRVPAVGQVEPPGGVEGVPEVGQGSCGVYECRLPPSGSR